MRWTNRYFLLLLNGSLLAACVTVRVEPLTREPLPANRSSTQVEVLDIEPTQAHVNLARIIAISDSASEERLRDKIVATAKRIGADAVVLGNVDVLHSMGPSPVYQSTLGPASASFSPYSWGGWWDPFYLDAWSFVQGASDETQWTMYLSGVALQYVRDREPAGANKREERAGTH